MLKFDFTNETGVKVENKFLQEVVKRLSKILKTKIDKLLGKRNGQIDLVLVSDETIGAMNQEYRGKKGPTDVISFAYLEVTEFEKEEGDVIVGDIFISADTAKKQAKKHGHDFKKELEILFVHGLLHLFGFDHKTKKQEAEMEKLASQILT